MNNTKQTISLFAVSFKQGFVSPNIPIATFRQGNKELRFLLDTGSENNVVNKAALDSIEHDMCENKNGVVTLSGVGGTTFVQTCNIKFDCGNEHYVADFLVSDLSEVFGMIKNEHGIEIHGLIGSTFLRNNNIVLDFKNLTAHNNKS